MNSVLFKTLLALATVGAGAAAGAAGGGAGGSGGAAAAGAAVVVVGGDAVAAMASDYCIAHASRASSLGTAVG
eukprot:119265-Prymnesium_polylepis.1